MGHMRCLDKASALWESGWWAIAPETAQKLVGGHIYFHKAQDKPSFFGGRITAARVETEGNWPGRIVFTFVTGLEFKGVRAGSSGWGMEKKLIFP
jgi:hypothetical protein